MLARPVPRVLWKCSSIGLSVPVAGTGVEQLGHPPRRGHAGGVAERDPVGTVGDAPGRTMHATRAGSMSPSNGQPKLVAMMTSAVAPALRAAASISVGDVVERLVGRAVHVLPVVRVARGHHDLDLTEPGVERASGAPAVRHERRVVHAGFAVRAGPDLVGVGHLRDRLRVHERDGLDPRDAGLARARPAARSCRRSEPDLRSADRRGGRPHGSTRCSASLPCSYRPNADQPVTPRLRPSASEPASGQ